MIQPGRSYTANNSTYRYGFNGKEKDPNITSEDYDYGARIYDARVVRFLSVDPLQKKYPNLTPYQFASNSPIVGIDEDGLELAIKNSYYQFDVSSGQPKLTFLRSETHQVHNGGWFGLRNYFEGQGLQNQVWAVDKDGKSLNWIPFSSYEALQRSAVYTAKYLAGDKDVVEQEKLKTLGYAVAEAVLLKGMNVSGEAFESSNNRTPNGSTNKQVTSAHGGNTNAEENNTATKRANQLQINKANSNASEEIVYKRLQQNLGKDEAILIKPRIYIGDGSSGEYAVPDFAIYNTKTGQFSRIVDAKDGGGGLTIPQQNLNKQGGTFRGSSRAPAAKPQTVKPNSIETEKTNVNSGN